MELRVLSGMTNKTLRHTALFSALSLSMVACGTMGSPAIPMPGPTPTPAPKPGSVVPAELSQGDAETTCLVQGSRKFSVPLKDIQVTGSKPVDAGYLVNLQAGGIERSCIIAKDGFVRSLR